MVVHGRSRNTTPGPSHPYNIPPSTSDFHRRGGRDVGPPSTSMGKQAASSVPAAYIYIGFRWNRRRGGGHTKSRNFSLGSKNPERWIGCEKRSALSCSAAAALAVVWCCKPTANILGGCPEGGSSRNLRLTGSMRCLVTAAVTPAATAAFYVGGFVAGFTSSKR